MQARAETHGVPFLLLGPGLLRAPPRRGITRPNLSVTAHVAAGPPTPADRLSADRLLSTRGWDLPALLQRAVSARRQIIETRLGGAWWAPDAFPGAGERIVVVAGEAETVPVSSTVLAAMLEAALAENPGADIIVLAPFAGRASRQQREILERATACGCTVLAEAVNPWATIERARRLYVAGGETGFLGLIAGREVRCFASSFYSGWGATIDDPAVPQREARRNIDEIVAATCLIATRYRDPYRQRAASFDDVLALLADWRRIEAANRRIAVCVGMSFWKRRRVADFLRSAERAPAFRRRAQRALTLARRRGGAIAVWASRVPAGLVEAAAREGIALIRVEDGFVRSVGLGSDFLPAASLVLDESGMYFDPRSTSDLEILLKESRFDARLIERACRLIDLLVARGITKYNVELGRKPASSFQSASPGQRVILVPGQVEDDLSVRLGGAGIRGNLELLTAVRASNPDAFILYKPHPDVEAGHRQGAVPNRLARNFADAIVRGWSTAALLERIDELHTLTSLAGFEALLRRRKVAVYGRPFYAGWGLTQDAAPIDRGRRLSLEELVAGVLILYPRYLDPLTRLPCGPEVVVERLDDSRLWRPGPLVAARRLQGVANRLWRRRPATP